MTCINHYFSQGFLNSITSETFDLFRCTVEGLCTLITRGVCEYVQNDFGRKICSNIHVSYLLGVDRPKGILLAQYCIGSSNCDC